MLPGQTAPAAQRRRLLATHRTVCFIQFFFCVCPTRFRLFRYVCIEFSSKYHNEHIVMFGYCIVSVSYGFINSFASIWWPSVCVCAREHYGVYEMAQCFKPTKPTAGQEEKSEKEKSCILLNTQRNKIQANKIMK